jgi:hypothetical protein
MGWFDASDYLVMDIATRNRVDELRSTVDSRARPHPRDGAAPHKKTEEMQGVFRTRADRWIRRARDLCGLRDRDARERLPQSCRNLKKIVVAQGVPSGHSV